MRFNQLMGGEHGPPRIPRWACTVLAAFLLLAGTATARADSIFVTLTGLSGPVGGFFTWTYDADLGDATLGGSTLLAGDYFGILDIAGVLDIAGMTAATPVGWVLSTPPLTPWSLLGGFPHPADSPAVANVVWTYGGAPVLSDAFLGTFSIITTVGGPPVNHIYGGDDTETGTLLPQTNFGIVGAPGPFAALVPLPAAVFGGMALFGLIGGTQLRRTRQV